MDIVIYHHRRSFIASSDAIGQLKGEPAIGGSLAGPNPDFFPHAFDDGLGVF
jgi:hypothetical protein